ncbi:uncharacterized protein MYCFIDRAFT_116413, partial [Pseudocercospora fijiensis CIRAD86]
QRSKRGCWTCRLRRKKCFEDGPPCLNCVERDVFCHGYGPKPDWKDKGVKEKREAARLALSSRRQSRQISSRYSTAATDTDQPHQSHPSMDLDTVFDFSNLLSSHSGTPFVPSALHDSSHQASLSGPSARIQNHDPVGIHGVQADLANLIVSRGPALPDEHQQETLSREYDLVMRFLDYYSPKLGTRDSSRGWLLHLLGRSRAFLQCSLSMAALRESSQFVSGSEPFRSTLQVAHKHHAYAIQIFAELQAGSIAVLGEDLIVATHLAHLESQFQCLPDCQSYLDLAASSLNNTSDHQEQAVPCPSHLQHKTSASAYFRAPEPTADGIDHTYLETQAAYCFCSLLIWNDAISCSIQRKAAPAAATYQKLLSFVDFSAVFFATTMCDGKALSILLDIMALDEWKRERQTRSELSYRNLLDKANDIECSIEKAMQGLSVRLSSPLTSPGVETLAALSSKSSRTAHVRTYIFLRAILIELHLTVSGGSIRAPEVQESVDRFIAAWEMHKSIMESQSLPWPFCVAGAVAIGAQREFFKAAMAASKLPAMQDLKRLLTLSWHEVDRPSSSGSPVEWRSWKELLPSTNIILLF